MLISTQILDRAGIEVRGEWDEWLPRTVIDSRRVEEGDLFWALATGRADAHEYVAKAFDAGAKIAAVSTTWAARNAAGYEGKILFVMEDTLAGLQALATEVRRSVGAYTVGITGSNGKTTTRELLAAALGTAGRTARSTANYNNHIGVPLTLLNMDGDEAFLVLEMGANHVGEIKRLCEIGHPEAGLITNIGDAHIGEFGGFDALKRAKGELFEALVERDGLAVVNLGDENVVDVAAKVKRKVGYTLGQIPEEWRSPVYLGEIVERDVWSRATLEVEGMRVKLALPGDHWATAALGAFAAAVEMGADPELALPALATVEPVEGRGRILDLGDGVELLDESYNSNVAAVEKALATLARRPGQRIAVLGDILELGEYEQDEHERVGRIPELDDIDRVYFVGERMLFAADEAEAMGHTGVIRIGEEEVGDLAGELLEDIEHGAGIVVKGSRLIGLERVVNGLVDARGNQREAK